MTGVFIATPHTRAFESEYVMSLWQTRLQGSLIWRPLNNMAVDDARNFLAGRFWEHEKKPEYLLFADSDATWHPGAVERLVSRDLPVVTGCIYRRKLPPMPCTGVYAGRNAKGHHLYEFATILRRLLEFAESRGLDEKTDNALCLEPGSEVDDLLEVDGCGQHFCLIRRDVLEKIRPPWFRCTSRGAGEDFYFSRKVREAGFPIYIDLTVHTGHLAGPGNEFGIRELISYFKYVKPEDVFAGGEAWEVE